MHPSLVWDCRAPPVLQPQGSWCGLRLGCGQLWDGTGEALLAGPPGWPLWEQSSLSWVGGDSCQHRKGKRSQVKLWKLPEPTPSSEFTGEAFRKRPCLCRRPGMSPGSVTQASQSQGPSEAAASLSRLWGKESCLCCYLATSGKWAGLYGALRPFSPFLDGPTVLLEISPLTFQVDFLR